MPRAEVGSTKHLNNKLKSKGLQRLRWYCQVCERQMRDENGFKCHTQSESHVRQMLIVGEDPRKAIQAYSNQFQRDFINLLKTSHGEKKVNINHFYQEYIANKEHVHMNATKWPSLTDYAKYLGKEGICRVEEAEKGLLVGWVDNSPDALRRQDAIRKKERQDKGDEEREQRLIREQVERAKSHAEAQSTEKSHGQESKTTARLEGEKIKLDFSMKPASVSTLSTPPKDEAASGIIDNSPPEMVMGIHPDTSNPAIEGLTAPAPKIMIGISSSKPKNVFAMARKNAFSAKKTNATFPLEKKPISQAERIMKEEIERKRIRESNDHDRFGGKKQKV